jgi:voltage-gated potassium channel
MNDDSPRLDAWERRTEWPLTGTALVFLAAYALPIAVPAVSDQVKLACEVVTWVAWAIFIIDYVARLAIAPDPRAFVRTNLLDLVVVVLPLLRPLRLVRLLSLVAVLNRVGARNLRGKVVTYAVGGTFLLVLLGALAITEAEAGEAGASITDLGKGFWWALTTITTVGYGDLYPVSITGRFVAAAMMIGGIALLGVVTATIASWLVQRVEEAGEMEQLATQRQVEELAIEVRALREELRRREGS